MGYRDLSKIVTEDGDEPGLALGRMTVTDDHLNRGGILHGGAIATMCDSAMGRAVMSTLDSSVTIATASLTITFLAAANIGDDLVVHATVRKGGRTTVVVEATITRESDGTEIATAIATFVVRPRR